MYYDFLSIYETSYETSKIVLSKCIDASMSNN